MHWIFVGLEKYVIELDRLMQIHSIALSRADFWILCSKAALEKALENSKGEFTRCNNIHHSYRVRA